MSNPGEIDTTPIQSIRQLAAYIAMGCRAPEMYRIGTEHEKFGFRHKDLTPPGYEGDAGIRALLTRIGDADWNPILDEGRIIGLEGKGRWNHASLSLEPGGQFELSGAPLADLHCTEAELNDHIAAVKRIAEPLGLGFAPLGFHPTATREDMPWVPKSRYAIMRRYMPLVGSRGFDMMLRTCTVQVNLDFSSEADMVRKLRVGLMLQPLATAIFANSPFVEGKISGLLSTRADVWTDTDNQRSGIPAVMFEDGFGFERYVEWLLDVPMYFVRRDGKFIDVAGRSFRDHMAGRIDPAFGAATLGDFADHMTTAFTDVRLKRYLEMRGADAGSPAMMVALSAFWVGLLYDPAALDAACTLLAKHPWTDYAALRPIVPARGLDAPWQGGTLRDLARDVLAIAQDGLRARARINDSGEDETRFLKPLDAIIRRDMPSQAEHWLERYRSVWRGDAGRILTEAAI